MTVLTTHIGTLYLVATPIGNLKDLTLRAIETLKQVSCILAEDTRHAKKLLACYGITTPLHAFHAHNEHQAANAWIARLEQGADLALISDAGTPLIQDPGFPLVQLAIIHQCPIVPLPGPCAFVTALVGSGVACDSFLFAGFLPVKRQAKQMRLMQLSHTEQTLIFYESTHRLLDTLALICDLFGSEYSFVVAKELTKTFETFIRGTGVEMLAFFNADPARTKGEFVLILPKIPGSPASYEDEKLLRVLLHSLSCKQAVAIASKLSQTSKRVLYQQALSISNSGVPS